MEESLMVGYQSLDNDKVTPPASFTDGQCH